ncbi:pirin-like C-terminal cupin domain-containing protein [Paraburkholderia bryophila]|uniref:Redox-sensitive bicupin YhaK (Pirin superfamily) n=1 Tax=Paraburkholderia bryophila TaxID=420952 RepID=A0A7Y9WQB4_9BURK|nr:redox-sensitive bicupin YhaK (pirin superfamily) [Paraburkholderia bryophila]
MASRTLTLEHVADDTPRVLFRHAEPIDEPIVACGPFVMNTSEDLNRTVADYHSRKFSVATT